MAKVRKRENGRYMLDFLDQYGTRQRITLPSGTLKKDAEEKLEELTRQVRAGKYVPVKTAKLFKDVAKLWLEYKKTKIRETTWETYEGHVNGHFGDFDNLKIIIIDTAMIEKFIQDRQEAGMKLGTLRKILVTLNQIFAYAVRHKYISNNPVRDAERPRDSKTAARSEKIRIMSREQIRAFLNAVEHPKYKMLFTLALFTGARQGELLGLKWGDIDFKKAQIHIRRTYNKKRFFDPKTAGSVRSIDLGPSVMADLKKWKVACPPNDLDLVFPTEKGNPINYSNMVQRYYQPALTKAKIKEKFRFHDLRHCYASIQIENGQNVVYISKQLGHSSPTVTLNVYAHLMKERNPEAALLLERSILVDN